MGEQTPPPPRPPRGSAGRAGTSAPPLPAVPLSSPQGEASPCPFYVTGRGRVRLQAVVSTYSVRGTRRPGPHRVVAFPAASLRLLGRGAFCILHRWSPGSVMKSRTPNRDAGGLREGLGIWRRLLTGGAAGAGGRAPTWPTRAETDPDVASWLRGMARGWGCGQWFGVWPVVGAWPVVGGVARGWGRGHSQGFPSCEVGA